MNIDEDDETIKINRSFYIRSKQIEDFKYLIIIKLINCYFSYYNY